MSQKVKALGFGLEFANRITVGHFCKRLLKFNGAEFDHWGTVNHIYSEVRDNVLVGLLLSLKGQRMFINSLKDASGRYRVEKHKLKDGEHGTEVSLFCINPASSRGLFITYWGGVGASKIRYAFRLAHDDLKGEVIKAFHEAGVERGDNRRETRKEANAAFKGKFEMPILSSTEQFEEVIARYRNVSNLRVTVEPGLLDAPLFRPLTEHIGNSSFALSFRKDSPGGKVITSIKSAFSKTTRERVKAMRLLGTSLEGEELSYLIGENKIEFWEGQFDDLVADLPDTTWNDFGSCPAMDKLLHAMRKNFLDFKKFPDNTSWLPGTDFEGISLEY